MDLEVILIFLFCLYIILPKAISRPILSVSTSPPSANEPELGGRIERTWVFALGPRRCQLDMATHFQARVAHLSEREARHRDSLELARYDWPLARYDWPLDLVYRDQRLSLAHCRPIGHVYRDQRLLSSIRCCHQALQHVHRPLDCVDRSQCLCTKSPSGDQLWLSLGMSYATPLHATCEVMRGRIRSPCCVVSLSMSFFSFHPVDTKGWPEIVKVPFSFSCTQLLEASYCITIHATHGFNQR